MTEDSSAAAELPSPDADAAKRQRRRRRFAIGCLLPIFTLIGGLALFEYYLRSVPHPFLGPAVDFHGMYVDDGVGFTCPKPGWEGTQTFDERTVRVSLDELGMRRGDDPASDAKHRVLVLGDSITFGFGVDGRETWPAVLGRELSAACGAPITVGNASAPGFSSRDHLTTWRRVGTTFDPEVVVVTLYPGNDFTDDAETSKVVIDGFWLRGPTARLARSSWRMRSALRFRTWLLVERAVNAWAPSYDLAKQLTPTEDEIAAWILFPPEPQRVGGLFMDRAEDDELVQGVLGRLRANWEQLRDEVAPRKLVAVIMPTYTATIPGAYADAVRRLNLDASAHADGRARSRVLAVAADLGLPCVDLTTVVAAAEDVESAWLSDKCHLSVDGCGVAARGVAPAVLTALGH